MHQQANTIAAGKRCRNWSNRPWGFGDLPHVRPYVEDDKNYALKKVKQWSMSRICISRGRTIYSLVKKFRFWWNKQTDRFVFPVIAPIIKALNSLSESEKFRFLVENQSDSISILDLQNRFTFINPATEKIFGTEKGKCSTNPFTVCWPWHPELIIAALRNWIRDTVSFEIPVKKPAGESCTLLVRATMLKQIIKPRTFVV
jgi:PAS domain S-box-containing protein